MSLFLQQGDIDEALLDTAWYLQAVATARANLQIYDLPRQRHAHQVSGHIFDLALQSTDDLTATERLRLTLAAQVGYLGGDLTPNAAALARRAPLPDAPFDWSEPGQMSLEAGVLVLALDRAALYPLLDARRDQLADLQSEIGDLVLTPFAAVDGVVQGARNLVTYLTYGSQENLEEAQQHFTRAVATAAAESDVDSRWVAAHLLRLSDALEDTSAWSALPPELPSLSRAMTLGDPPVLSLWPPQLSFLAGTEGGPSPLDPGARRMMLSFPTSAGKTLLAQVLILAHVASSELGDVCVVAPTHSLCRELGNSLNRRLRTLGGELNAIGIGTCPVLIDDLVRADRATPFDLIVTPLFHIGEVLEVVEDEDRVVELNFVASAGTLREMATLSTDRIVTVVAPTTSGAERTAGLVRTVFRGQVEQLVHTPGDSTKFDDMDVLVYVNALQVDPEDLARPNQVIRIDWQLSGSSAEQLRTRVLALNGDRRPARGAAETPRANG